MSDSNLTKHPDDVHIGPARVMLLDETNDWLVDLGKTDEVTLSKAIERASLMEIFNGVAVTTKSQSIGESYNLSMKLSETLDPNTQYLVFKNCGTPSLNPICSLRQIKEFMPNVYKGRSRVLSGNAGFYGTGVLPPPAAVTTDDLDDPTGGLDADTYSVYVIAVYEGGAVSNAVAGTPVGITGTESLMIEITPPADGSLPDHYDIYIAGAGEVPNYYLWGSSYGGIVIFTDNVTGGALMPADGASSFTVTSEDGLTTYDAGVDYTIDPSCAKISFLADGALCDGQAVLVTYSQIIDPFTTMSIGPSDRVPKFAHPVIIAMKKDDRETPAGRGLEIHLWKVDLESGWDWVLSALNYDSGFNLTCPVLFSELDLNFGEVYTYHRQFTCYNLYDLRALTEYSQAASCDLDLT